MVPVGNVEIQGNFIKADNNVTFSPVSDYIIFRNTTQKEITNSGNAATLNFYNLRVAIGSAVATTSSFQVTKEVDVLANASLKATNGTITMTSTADWIKNVSTQTLE